MPTHKVFCVDDSEAITGILVRFLRQEPDLEVVGTKSSGEGLAEVIRDRAVAVLILDLAMAGQCPLELIRALTDACPGCRIVVYSAHDDTGTIASAMGAGAFAFVSKFADFPELLAWIRKATQSESRTNRGSCVGISA